MDNIRELKAYVKPLINQWFMLNNKFLLWEEYKSEVMDGSKTIQITMKNTYFDGRSKSYKNMKEAMVNTAFKKLVKELGAELLHTPFNAELAYEDALRWLYHHYPFGEGNFTNCILVSWMRIVAIQWNWLKHTRMLHCDVVIPDYIVLNNKKKLEWSYTTRDLEDLEPILKKLFNNNN